MLATRGVRVARDTGALNLLANAANYLAALNVHSGTFATAAALIDEVEAITEATGLPPLKYADCMLIAARARSGAGAGVLRNLVGERDGARRGLGAWHVLGRLWRCCKTAAGHYAEALAAARQACEHEDVIAYGWGLVELIEASVRVGRPDEAAAALDRLSERTRASGTDWALGTEAGSRALLSEGQEAESLYHEAVERLARSRGVIQLARARLLYGEWLRRENRRVDAREQLRAAHETFSGIGAEGSAERARHELAATGETARRRTNDARGVLTPQEAQIARLAMDGLSNPEIGAQLQHLISTGQVDADLFWSYA